MSIRYKLFTMSEIQHRRKITKFNQLNNNYLFKMCISGTIKLVSINKQNKNIKLVIINKKKCLTKTYVIISKIL